MAGHAATCDGLRVVLAFPSDFLTDTPQKSFVGQTITFVAGGLQMSAACLLPSQMPPIAPLMALCVNNDGIS